MSTPEVLKDLLVTVLGIQRVLAGPDPDKFSESQEAYRELLDGFYEEYQALIANG